MQTSEPLYTEENVFYVLIMVYIDLVSLNTSHENFILCCETCIVLNSKEKSVYIYLMSEVLTIWVSLIYIYITSRLLSH